MIMGYALCCPLRLLQAGLTESFLNSLLDAQGANEYVKVRSQQCRVTGGRAAVFWCSLHCGHALLCNPH